MSKIMNKILEFVDCYFLLIGLGVLSLFSILRTGIVAGGGGSWGWWLLLALLLIALTVYTWVYCGRDAVKAREAGSGTADPGKVGGKTATAAGGTAVAEAAGVEAGRPGEEAKVSGASSSASVTGDARSKSEPDKAKTDGSASPATSGTQARDRSASRETSLGGSGTQTGTRSETVPDDGATAGGEAGEPEGEKPPVMASARDGKGDDLKKISGVGSKLQDLLNGLGFFHFDQIAAWTAENVAWVDTHLGFKGRIERDDWVGQAKTLGAGRTTEFSERVARGEVASSKDD